MALPKNKRTANLYIDIPLHDAISRVAILESRSFSAMATRLLKMGFEVHTAAQSSGATDKGVVISPAEPPPTTESLAAEMPTPTEEEEGAGEEAAAEELD